MSVVMRLCSVLLGNGKGRKGQVGGLVKSRMNGLLPPKRTIKQTTETTSLVLKQ